MGCSLRYRHKSEGSGAAVKAWRSPFPPARSLGLCPLSAPWPNCILSAHRPCPRCPLFLEPDSPASIYVPAEMHECCLPGPVATGIHRLLPLRTSGHPTSHSVHLTCFMPLILCTSLMGVV